jgi:hypothetical protein
MTTHDSTLLTLAGLTAHPSETLAVGDLPETTALASGTVINGRYTVRRAIGHGGMCWVYDVADALNPDRAVALKIAKGHGANAARLSLFKTEFSTMCKLDHPNVARVYDFEEIRGSDDFAITMERIDGQPIDEALRAHDWRSVVERLAQVCRALSYVCRVSLVWLKWRCSRHRTRFSQTRGAWRDDETILTGSSFRQLLRFIAEIAVYLSNERASARR